MGRRLTLLSFALAALGAAALELPPGAKADPLSAPDYPLADAPRLSVPVDCAGTDLCAVQNYVDFAPGPEARDHTCGPLTYNGHQGIDIRLRSIAAMERGVAVLAAAGGTVIAQQDDVPDRLLNQEETRAALRGLVKPSNSVSIYHGNGWITHYGHLRQGSVRVAKGQKVLRGQPLGLIGASGSTNFPHLHFVLQHRQDVIDPYSGRTPDSGCGAGLHHSFWDEEAAELLAYRPSGVLDAGFAETAPSPAKIRSGKEKTESLPTSAEQLVFWTQIWGLRRSDRIRMRLYAADGALLTEITQRAEDNSPIHFRYLSVQRGGEAWSAGVYRGEYSLERPSGTGDEKFDEVLKIIRKIELR